MALKTKAGAAVAPALFAEFYRRHAQVAAIKCGAGFKGGRSLSR